MVVSLIHKKSSLLGLGPSVELEIALNGVEGRKMGTWKNVDNEPIKYIVYMVCLDLT